MYALLNYLDAPVRFLIFTIPEALSLVVPFCWGIVLQKFWLGALGGFVAFSLVRLIAQRFSVQDFRGLVYWYFPTRPKAYQLPVMSYIREYLVLLACVSLMGCSASERLLECPAQRVPRCQSVSAVYKEVAKDYEKKTSSVFVYSLLVDGEVQEGRVLI